MHNPLRGMGGGFFPRSTKEGTWPPKDLNFTKFNFGFGSSPEQFVRVVKMKLLGRHRGDLFDSHGRTWMQGQHRNYVNKN